jgi:glycosyltransferase involved in cell wall biosynthesis
MFERKPLTIGMMIETVGLGGAEMVVLRLAEELRARGHTVHPVVPLGRDGWLLGQLRDAGFKWHTYDLRRPIDPTLPPRLGATLEDLGVDVVHSHEFTMSVYGAAACRRIRVPHIITMHGNQTMTQKWNRRAALRWAFRRSRATVAVSEDTRRHLEATVPNGMPDRAGNRGRVRNELGIADHEVLLLAVGSLTPRKGHAILLDAMKQLTAQLPDFPWRVAIAGGGPERERLLALIDEYGFAGKAQLLGERNDIPDLQAAADIFVLPSLWEGLPLAIIEAMFAGNAIVASEASGIPEAITKGEHGLLTPPGEAAPLAEALRSVMVDPAYRQKLGEAALQRARTKFTIAAMTDAYEQLYLQHVRHPARLQATTR